MAEPMTVDDLWTHLVFDHGAHVQSAKHGDATLMHGVAHGMLECDHGHGADGQVIRDE